MEPVGGGVLTTACIVKLCGRRSVAARHTQDEIPRLASLEQGLQNRATVKHLRKPRRSGEGAGKVFRESRPFTFRPRVIGSTRQQGLGIDRGALDPQPPVGHDLAEQRVVVDVDAIGADGLD